MVSFIAVLGLSYLLLCLLLFVFQRQMIYLPSSEVTHPGVEYTVLETGDVDIKVWIVNPGKEKALIYFGGNAENVAYNINDFQTLFGEHTVYLVNYRGYGGSSGSPHEEGLYSDALSVYDHFMKSHTALSAMGRSIGAAVATYLASKRPIERLILVTPFDSAVSVGQKLYRFFPMDLLLKERLDAAGMAAMITTDTLIIAAGNDEIVPYENTENLIHAFSNAPMDAVTLDSVGHNSVHHHPDYRRIIRSFMK